MRRLALILSLLVTAPVAAQVEDAAYTLAAPDGEPTEADVARARALYVAAGAELEAARWADAADLFARSYRLSGVPAALFNHATALRSLGRHRDARDAFAQLLRAHPELDAERRAEAEARMREEAGRVALVLLTGLADAPDARVLLDGQRRPSDADPVALETDPGTHAVVVEREGYERWRRELTLSDGERQSLRAELVAIDRESLAESPVLWTLVAIVVVGAAVTAGVVGYYEAQLDPQPPYGASVIEL